MVNSRTTEKPARRITPIISCMESTLSYWMGDAERADDRDRATALYAVLWFIGSARAFSGCARALSHMTRGTLRAYVDRVQAGMLERARAAGRDVIAPADLNNEVLIRAFGERGDLNAAVTRIAAHPYGVRLTIG